MGDQVHEARTSVIDLINCAGATPANEKEPHAPRDEPHGWLRHENTPGNPATALRCGAKTPAGTPCRAPALRTKLRCRMHGGKSSGPRTLDGVARIRAARTQHGRYSAVERRFQRWLRQYVANGYRSARAMLDQRAREHFLMRAREPIRAALLAAQRQVAADEVARQDAARVGGLGRGSRRCQQRTI
jgi:hypothetical protein